VRSTNHLAPNKNGKRKDSTKVFKRKVHHKPVGRPRNRWVDAVERDALQLVRMEENS